MHKQVEEMYEKLSSSKPQSVEEVRCEVQLLRALRKTKGSKSFAKADDTASVSSGSACGISMNSIVLRRPPDRVVFFVCQN